MSKKKCGCNKKEQSGCGCEVTCGCKMKLSAKCVIYEGKDLPCLGLTAGDNLENALIKLDEIICRLQLVIAPPPPTKHDITDKVSDPFDFTEAAFQGNLYNAGDTLLIGTVPNCPSFVYQVFDDGAGQNCVIMTVKPPQATSNTSS